LYSPEFKDEAVRQILEREYSVAEVSQRLGITYIRTWQGWLYLAVVVDLFSRKVVG
jgi:putative transposase